MLSSAQGPQHPVPAPPNDLTLKLLLDQRPENVPEEQWARLVNNPANALQLAIRITQAMLDTIDASQLDQRYQYVMVDSIR